MSKILKVAALVVGAAALIVATGGAAAIGIGTAASAGTAAAAGVAATAGIAASVGGITASTLSLIAGGLSIAASLTAKRPTAGGVATQFKADPTASIPYLMGRSFTAGNIIYRRTHNTVGYSLPDLQTFVVILSGAGPVQEIESFTSDKAIVTFSAGNAVGGFSSWMFQKTQLGAQPEAAALTVGTGGGITTSAPPGWGASNKLSGYAAAIWTLRYDLKSKIYSQGMPAPGWVVKGVKCYDPRLDSTYPGGSGSCRALTESTYVYSENPYLHALTYALGRFQNGKRVIGVGAPVVGIDVAAFVEGANVADANGWKVGGIIYSGDNKWSVLKNILQAGGGEPIHLGARLSCIVNAPKVTLATITEADVIGERSATGTQPRRDRINRIIPRYRSEAHGWQIIPAAPVVVAAHVTTDGGERTKEVNYPLVQQLTQVAQLARYDIENAREFGPISLPLKLRWLGYKPGDQLAVNLPDIGLNGQTILVTNRDLDVESATVTLIGRSETPAKHAFALGQTTTAPDTPTLTTPPTAPTPASGIWAITGLGLVSGGNVTPLLRVTGAATDEPVDGVVFEFRPYNVGNGPNDNWIAAGREPPTVTKKDFGPVLPATAYEVAVSYQLGTLISARRILGPETTSAAGVQWSGISGTGTPEAGATRNVNRGAWAGSTAYLVGDIVTQSGSSYTANTAHTSTGGSPPPNANWTLLASGGAAGTSGFTIGPIPSISIACDAAGNDKPGQLPKTVQLAVFSGTTNITATATYSLASPTGGTFSITTGGLLSQNTVFADDGFVNVTATFGGISVLQRVNFAKAFDGAPGNSVIFGVTTPVGTGVSVTGGPAELAVPAGTTVYITCNADWDNSAGPNQTVTLTAQYSVNGGSSWTTAGSASGYSAAGDVGEAALATSVASSASARAMLVRIQTQKTASATLTRFGPAKAIVTATA